MAAFNPMEGFTVAKNPWRNTKYGQGTHYFRTSTPRVSDSDDVQQVRNEFSQAAKKAARECSERDGLDRTSCQLDKVADMMEDT